MTFTEIVTAITEQLNLTSSDAVARVGRKVNRAYKRVTASIGLNVSRRTQILQAVTLGNQYVTFTGVEKITAVIDKSSGADRFLDLVSVEEVQKGTIHTDAPKKYAIYRMNAGSVQIITDSEPQDALDLYADGYVLASTLSGSQEPAFPESFHDILVEEVLAKEYTKKGELVAAKESKETADDLLGDLRMFIAKEAWQDIYVGKMVSTRSRTFAGGGSSSSTINGAQSYTQEGLVTFDRGAGNAPFAVDEATAAVVTNLDADKLDGQHGSYYQDASNLNAGTIPDGRFPATLPAISGANLTNLDASDLASGTVPDARFPATLPAISGANLTNLDASDLASGTVPVARLGAGTFSVTTSTTTGATNNWAPTLAGNTLIEWNGAADAAFTGLDGGVVGQIVVIKNVTAAKIATFAHGSGSSDADNQFQNLVTSAATPVAPGGWIMYQHDGTDWKLIGHKQGAPITVTFAAGDFTAASGNWTVDALDIVSIYYELRGKMLMFAWDIAATDVSATPTDLRIAKAQYGGFTTAKTVAGACSATDAGTRGPGFWVVAAANAYLKVEKETGANYTTTSSDNTGTFGVAEFEVA